MTGPVCLVEYNGFPGNTPDLVAVAQRHGHEVVVATSTPTAASDALPADVELVAVDTTDGDAVAAALEGRGAAAVLTAHDFYVPAAAVAAARLGLPGPDPVAAHRCRRKDEQRRRLADHGVLQPRFDVAATAEDAVAVAMSIGFPVVVKPVALADSIGVRLCDDADAVLTHANALARFRPRRPVPGHIAGELMVESVLTGPEFTVEVFEGRAVAIAETRHAPPPGFIEAEHVVASPHDADTGAEHAGLKDAAETAVAALGLGFGPVHVELRITELGPAIVEVNARLAGGWIPRLHQVTHGIDLWEMWLCAALGQEVEVAVTHDRAGVLRIVYLADSTAQPTSRVRTSGFSGELVLNPTTPEVTGRPTYNSEHAGLAIATGPTAADCLRQLDDLWDQLERQLPIWRPSASVRL